MGKGDMRLLTGKNDAVKVAPIMAVAGMVGAKVVAEETNVNEMRYRQNVGPTGASPGLETQYGYITGHTGILRFLGEMGDGALVGRTIFERSVVDSMMELAVTEILPLVGTKPTAEHSQPINTVLSGLNMWLENKTFLASEKLTIADVLVAFSLLPLYQNVLDPAARKPYTDLNRFMDTIINQPACKKHIKGSFCTQAPGWYNASAKPVAVTQTQQAPAAQAQKGSDKKAEKKEKKKDGDKEQPAWKKEAEAKKKSNKPVEVDAGTFDLRVGLVKEVKKHPNADTLYVEMIDVGDAEPRQICSGLVAHMGMDQIDKKHVMVLCNLKPQKMRDVMSNGMVMCSTSAEGVVGLVTPPKGAAAGDKITFAKFETGAEKAQIPPKKVEGLLAGLKADDKGVVTWNGEPAVVASKGEVTCPHPGCPVK